MPNHALQPAVEPVTACTGIVAYGGRLRNSYRPTDVGPKCAAIVLPVAIGMKQSSRFPFGAEWNIVLALGPGRIDGTVPGDGEALMIMRLLALLGMTLLGLAPLIGPAGAADDKTIAIELNKTTDTDAGCRLTFVVKNDTASLLEKTSYEIAAFDGSKTVMKLLKFEFGRLPVGKTKVVEFALAGVACTNISRILVNTSPECVADGAASTVCLDALRTSSLTQIVFDQ